MGRRGSLKVIPRAPETGIREEIRSLFLWTPKQHHIPCKTRFFLKIISGRGAGQKAPRANF